MSVIIDGTTGITAPAGFFTENLQLPTIDAVGIVTARSGIEFGLSGVGGSITPGGTATFAGSVTAASFTGNINGNITGNAAGLTGTPNINVGILTATSATINGSITGTGSISGTSASVSGNLSAGSSITSSSTVFDSKGNIRSVPVNDKSTAYTLVAADAGKIVTTTGGGTITVPAGVFSVGDVITIYNKHSGSVTISPSGVATLTLVVSGNTGSRTLLTKGICTVICINLNEFIISGSGLS